MNDITYTLAQTNKERTITARGIYGKKTGSKTKYCGLPSDHLTEAEKRKLNGPCLTYDLSIPHTYAELKLWPEDLQRQYLGKLLTMRPTNVQLQSMLQTSSKTLYYFLGGLGLLKPKVGRPPKANAAQVHAWNQFIDGNVTPPEPEPIITQEPEPEQITTQEPEPEPITTQEPEPKTTCDSIELVFTGTMPDVLKALTLLPIGKKDRHRITIRVE